MSSFEIGLLSVVIFVCVYALVDRVCKCIEQCALGKSYQEFIKMHSELEKKPDTKNA